MDDVVQGGRDFLLTTMMVGHLQKVIRYRWSSFSSAMSVGDKLKNIQLIIVHHAARRKIIFDSLGERVMIRLVFFSHLRGSRRESVVRHLRMHL